MAHCASTKDFFISRKAHFVQLFESLLGAPGFIFIHFAPKPSID